MRKLLIVLCFCLCAIGCVKKTVPVHSVGYQVPMVDGQAHVTKAQIRNAILLGCQDKKWAAVDAGPDTIEASILVRHKHDVTITITYSATGYSIDLKSSQNMKESVKDGGRVIHKAYYKWIDNLNYNIKKHLTQKVTNLP